MNNIRETYNFLNEIVNNQTNNTDISVLQKHSERVMLDVGHICLYKNIPIGVVVLLDPLTIIDIDSGYQYDNMINSHWENYNTAYKYSKEYKTPGTKKKDWHLPSIDELEKIGFKIIKDNWKAYKDSEHFPPNLKCLRWLDKVNKGLNTLPLPSPICSDDDENRKSVDDFWAEGERINEYDQKPICPKFNLWKIWTNRPNSRFLIEWCYKNHPMDGHPVANGLRFFCNSPKLTSEHFTFIHPDLFDPSTHQNLHRK